MRTPLAILPHNNTKKDKCEQSKNDKMWQKWQKLSTGGFVIFQYVIRRAILKRCPKPWQKVTKVTNLKKKKQKKEKNLFPLKPPLF